MPGISKNAIILHGTGCTPESFWYPSLKKFLEDKGYRVWVPQLPEAGKPDLKTWLTFVLKSGQFNEETILIGHSAGGPLILSILENITTPISRAILVAGYARPKGRKKEAEAILQTRYDWEKIKHNVRDLIFINSDNDPWGCDDLEGRYMQEHLGGTLIVNKGEGHMGSDSFHQPYREFPLLEELLATKNYASI